MYLIQVKELAICNQIVPAQLQQLHWLHTILLFLVLVNINNKVMNLFIKTNKQLNLPNNLWLEKFVKQEELLLLFQKIRINYWIHQYSQN